MRNTGFKMASMVILKKGSGVSEAETAYPMGRYSDGVFTRVWPDELRMLDEKEYASIVSQTLDYVSARNGVEVGMNDAVNIPFVYDADMCPLPVVDNPSMMEWSEEGYPEGMFYGEVKVSFRYAVASDVRIVVTVGGQDVAAGTIPKGSNDHVLTARIPVSVPRGTVVGCEIISVGGIASLDHDGSYRYLDSSVTIPLADLKENRMNFVYEKSADGTDGRFEVRGVFDYPVVSEVRCGLLFPSGMQEVVFRAGAQGSDVYVVDVGTEGTELSGTVVSVNGSEGTDSDPVYRYSVVQAVIPPSVSVYTITTTAEDLDVPHVLSDVKMSIRLMRKDGVKIPVASEVIMIYFRYANDPQDLTSILDQGGSDRIYNLRIDKFPLTFTIVHVGDTDTDLNGKTSDDTYRYVVEPSVLNFVPRLPDFPIRAEISASDGKVLVRLVADAAVKSDIAAECMMKTIVLRADESESEWTEVGSYTPPIIPDATVVLQSVGGKETRFDDYYRYRII